MNVFIKEKIFVDKRYYKDVFTLALPIILANAGQALVAIVDNIMVGQLGAVPLAAASLAGIIVTNILVFGMGVAISLTPIVGSLFVNKDYRKCAIFFENSISLNLIIGITVAVLMLAATPLLGYIGQEAEVVELAKPFYVLLAFSIVPYMIFLSFKQFMEGVGNTKISMSITLACNVLNIILNYVLIYGKFGFPEMGAVGAAVSTLVSRMLMPIAFIVYMYKDKTYRRFFYFFKKSHLRVRKHLQLLKVGLPISAQMVVEITALSLTAIMVGWIGATSLAASQITLSVISFMFMVTTGISGALTILVSHEFGNKNGLEISKYSKAGISMAALFMCGASLLFLIFPTQIASIFTSDAEVIAIASKLFIVAVFLEISDGIQVTALGGLRGMKDVNPPMIYGTILYIFVNIPLSYVFGFVLDWGPSGVWLGFVICVSCAAALFVRRLLVKARTIRN